MSNSNDWVEWACLTFSGVSCCAFVLIFYGNVCKISVAYNMKTMHFLYAENMLALDPRSMLIYVNYWGYFWDGWQDKKSIVMNFICKIQQDYEVYEIRAIGRKSISLGHRMEG